MKAFRVFAAAAVIVLFTVAAHAGIRGPGKYNGVVLYDRWDECYLYSAIYLMYIPEKQKDILREFAGQSVVLDVTKVYQPINPGDGLLQQFTMASLSQPGADWQHLENITLTASVDVTDPLHPSLKIVLVNNGIETGHLRADDLAFTIFAPNPAGPEEQNPFHVSDGPSYALQTRAGLFGMDTTPWQRKFAFHKQRVAWKVRGQDDAVSRFDIPPGRAKEFVIDFTLSPGQYDLVFGYGGGAHGSKSFASNLIAVDVNADGRVTLPRIAGR